MQGQILAVGVLAGLVGVSVASAGGPQGHESFLIQLLHQAGVQGRVSVGDGTSRFRVAPDLLERRIATQQARLLASLRSGESVPDLGRNALSLARTSGGGSISGSLFEQDGSTPIRHLVAVIVYDDLGFWAGADYVSGRNSYRVTDLPPGDYYVLASSEDYVDEFYDDAQDVRDAVLVQVVSDQETSGIDFVLEPSATGSSSIKGRVRSEAGTPLTPCTILALSSSGDLGQHTQTDPQGRYTIRDLPAGDYRLYCRYIGPQGANYAPQWYSGKGTYSDADVIHLAAGQTLDGIDFVLREAGAIAGWVYRPDGQPVGAYDCYLNAFDADGDPVSQGPTDSTGHFVIGELPAGQFKIQYAYYGPGGYLGGWYRDAADEESATPIGVTYGDTTGGIDITLTRGATIAGRVFGPDGQPISWDVQIQAHRPRSEEVFSAQAEENGCYAITGLPSGRYKLFAEYMPWVAPDVLHTPADEWYPGVYDSSQAAWVTVAPGDSVSGVDFTMRAGGAIDGRVYGPGGQPLSYSGTVIAYTSDYRPVERGRVANGGIFVVAGLPTGRYRLFFRYEGDEDLASEFYDGSLTFEGAKEVTAVADHWTHNIDFTVEHPCRVEGIVRGEAGEVLTDREHFVLIYALDAATGEVEGNALGSLVGGYRLRILSGSYKLVACTGYVNSLPAHDSLACVFYPSGVGLDDPDTELITAANGATRRLEEIRLPKAGGGISGQVFDPENDALVRKGVYMVFAYDEDGCLNKFSLYSDQMGSVKGDYRLLGLRPGKYYVLVVGREEVRGETRWERAMWYGAVPFKLNENLSPFRVQIPPSAEPVLVGGGIVRGIDVHLGAGTGVAARSDDGTPRAYELLPNYPNPFNPSTAVTYYLPRATEVDLGVFDVRGRRVATLARGPEAAGVHTAAWRAEGQASGVYLIRLKVGGKCLTRKCLLVK